MKLGLDQNEFNKLSGEAKKKYIANLFITQSLAKPVTEGALPVAFVMAGLPGAGKTEFLDSLSEDITSKGFEPFVRIDLDDIVSVYPHYTPKDHNKFRSQGNLVLARTIDVARRGKYNMLIDGTFSGLSGASVKSITQLLAAGYKVNLVYMFDDAEVSWDYTNKRKVETGRSIEYKDFMKAIKNITINLKEVLKLHSNNPNFSMRAVVQKELRDKDYNIITQYDRIDKLIETGYNLNNLKGNRND